MLMHFDSDDDWVYVNGRMPLASGTHLDLSNRLGPGNAYRGLPYATLRAAGAGTLNVDELTGACEILRPDDPRLHASMGRHGPARPSDGFKGGRWPRTAARSCTSVSAEASGLESAARAGIGLDR